MAKCPYCRKTIHHLIRHRLERIREVVIHAQHKTAVAQTAKEVPGYTTFLCPYCERELARTWKEVANVLTPETPLMIREVRISSSVKNQEVANKNLVEKEGSRMAKAGKPQRIFLVALDEKCGGCNWRVQNLYLVASSKEEAMELYKAYGERGLCADCLVEMLIETDTKLD